jgi:hypothetical protein
MSGHGGTDAHHFAAALETVFFHVGALLGVLLLASALRRRLWLAS